MNNFDIKDPMFEKAVRTIFDGEVRKEQDELQKTIDALTPLFGAADAEIAAVLDQEIRMEPRRQIAKLGADFIRDRLNAPSPLRQLMKMDEPIPMLVVNKKP